MKAAALALSLLLVGGAAEAQTFGPTQPCGAYSTCTNAIGGASLTTGQISVGTTATLVVAARSFRQQVGIENTTTTPIYCGGPGVTTTTGQLLPGAVGASLLVNSQAAVYCVAGATAVVTYMETY